MWIIYSLFNTPKFLNLRAKQFLGKVPEHLSSVSTEDKKIPHLQQLFPSSKLYSVHLSISYTCDSISIVGTSYFFIKILFPIAQLQRFNRIYLTKPEERGTADLMGQTNDTETFAVASRNFSLPFPDLLISTVTAELGLLAFASGGRDLPLLALC